MALSLDLDGEDVWLGVPDFVRSTSTERYQDPVLGAIAMPPLLLQALDLEAVQRLRSIKQTSGLDLVYSGATHTRFEHSVGVMWLAGQAHDTLATKARRRGGAADWPTLNIASKLAVMLAGLFHDLGHGPYSHTYDSFLKRLGQPGKHEATTFEIVTSDTQIGEFLLAICRRLTALAVKRSDLRGLTDLLLKENVAALATKQPLVGGDDPQLDTNYGFLKDIVCGVFDVDRLDYLRRDAVHTGLPVSIEPNEIISGFTLAKVSRVEPLFESPRPEVDATLVNADITDTDLVWKLKIDRSAAEALEWMLSARDMAYRKLYYQRTHRAGQEMLILAMQRLTGTDSHSVNTGMRPDPNDLRKWDDTTLFSKIMTFKHQQNQEPDPLLKTLHDGLTNRKLYEPLPFVWKLYGWPEDVPAELTNLRQQDNRKLQDRMYKAAADVKMRLEGENPERVLLDIDETPVLSADAYRTRLIWCEFR